MPSPFSETYFVAFFFLCCYLEVVVGKTGNFQGLERSVVLRYVNCLPVSLSG